MNEHVETIRMAIDFISIDEAQAETVEAMKALLAENQRLRDALDRGKRFERCYQESLGAVWTAPMQERLDSLQSAFLDAYSEALAGATE